MTVALNSQSFSLQTRLSTGSMLTDPSLHFKHHAESSVHGDIFHPAFLTLIHATTTEMLAIEKVAAADLFLEVTYSHQQWHQSIEHIQLPVSRRQ